MNYVENHEIDKNKALDLSNGYLFTLISVFVQIQKFPGVLEAGRKLA